MASKDKSATTTKKTKSKSKKSEVVRASGAVLWQPASDSGEPLIALIHRQRYDDWSLPKGKVDPGETEPVTAVREIHEETGQRAHLGRRLCRVTYPIPIGTKVVHYWVARGLGGEFSPTKEVDQLVWFPVNAAKDQLTYPHDRKVVAQFTKRPADTRTVLIVRHATAGRKARYKGDDTQRPLDKNGRAQAKSLVPQLMAFGATALFAADRLRCVQTIEPLARKLDLPVTVEPTLTEEAYAADPEAARQRLLEITALGGTPAICSQGRVIPYLIDWWCERDGVEPDRSRNRKGSTWVLSLSGDRLIAADHLPSPLAEDQYPQESRSK
jgi:8-oxo-dGTP diphosphatase